MSKLDEMAGTAGQTQQGGNAPETQGSAQGNGLAHEATGGQPSTAQANTNPAPQTSAALTADRAARQPAPPMAAPKPVGPRTILVLDTTAKDSPRTHEQLVNDALRSFTFMPGRGLPLPAPIAAKFLKHEDTFKAVDEDGNILEWRRAPKQPDELGAGEAITIKDTETIARVDELSKNSLLLRAVEMPGGEQFTTDTPRQVLIDFVIATTVARKKAKAARPENGPDDFTPAPDDDFGEDEAA